MTEDPRFMNSVRCTRALAAGAAHPRGQGGPEGRRRVHGGGADEGGGHVVRGVIYFCTSCELVMQKIPLEHGIPSAIWKQYWICQISILV